MIRICQSEVTLCESAYHNPNRVLHVRKETFWCIFDKCEPIFQGFQEMVDLENPLFGQCEIRHLHPIMTKD